MCTAVVVDSNCIASFQEERLAGVSGPATVAIKHVFDCGSIALDDGGILKQEWLNTASYASKLSLEDWIADQMSYGLIRAHKVRNDRTLRRSLIELGLPNDDVKLFQIANSSAADGIISEDSDLYEPKSKRWSANKKTKLKQDQSGCICRFARRQLELAVMPLNLVPDQLSPCPGDC